jgi:SAM-dependent methyltransferase
MRATTDRWNHNTLYHPDILRAVPAGCERALDVGCGEGTLTRQLHQVIPEVIGIDTDQTSITAARTHLAGDICYVHGDVLTHPFEPGSFGLVTAVASLHHLDTHAALDRFANLLQPSGVLAVIGVARSSLADLPLDIAAIVPNRLRRLRAPWWQHPSPVQPAAETYSALRHLTARLLPGSRFQRRLYWRYTLTWTKP